MITNHVTFVLLTEQRSQGRQAPERPVETGRTRALRLPVPGSWQSLGSARASTGFRRHRLGGDPRAVPPTARHTVHRAQPRHRRRDGRRPGSWTRRTGGARGVRCAGRTPPPAGGPSRSVPPLRPRPRSRTALPRGDRTRAHRSGAPVPTTSARGARYLSRLTRYVRAHRYFTQSRTRVCSSARWRGPRQHHPALTGNCVPAQRRMVYIQ